MAKIFHGETLLWDRIEVANNPIKRFKGLMCKRALSDGEGMLITPCRQVHTFHMHFSLDVLFITKDWRVAAITTLSPGKVGPKIKEAAMVLEVPAGSSKRFNILPGDQICIERNKKQGGMKR